MLNIKNILPIHKIKTGVVLVLSGLIVFLAIGFTTAKQEFRTVKSIKIDISKDHNHEFIDEADVLKLMTNSGTDELIDQEVRRVDLKELERRIKKNTFAYEAHVHKDLAGDLFVNIEQCHPIARVLMPSGDFYVSDKGTILPMSDKFTARVPIVSGYMTGKLLRQDFAMDSTTAPFFTFFHMIEKDKFLKTMIAEIDLNHKGEITVYPQMGKQRFEFGNFEDIEDKVLKFKIFYKHILPVKGWNFCERVNLKFKDQIITE